MLIDPQLSFHTAVTLSFHTTLIARWCVTGTPISRGLEDLFGLFAFLRVSPWGDSRAWWNKAVQVLLRVPMMCVRVCVLHEVSYISLTVPWAARIHTCAVLTHSHH